MKRNLFRQIKPALCWIIVCSVGVIFAACNPIAPMVTPQQTIESPDTPTPRVSPSSTIQPETTPAITPEPQSVIQLSEEDLKGAVIRFWHNWSGPSGDLITSLVEDFNLNNPYGILAVEIYQGSLDEIDENMTLLEDTLDRPDLVVGYLHQALAWDDQVGLVNLDDYLLDPVWGYSASERAEFFPVFLEYEVHQEKRLGIPAQRSGHLLFYNQGWARELGFEAVPSSSDEFLQQACAAAQANRASQPAGYAGTGGWVISIEYPAIMSWFAAFDAEIYQETTEGASQGVYSFNRREVRLAYEFLRNMYDQGCAWMPENPYPETHFAERKALFASGSTTEIPYFNDAMGRAGNNDEWTVIAYPGPDGNQAIDVYGTAFVILKSSEKQQLAAWLLTKWLLQPENQARLLQTTYAFPLRIAHTQIGEQSATWKAAIELLQFAQVQPPSRSWRLVRWTLTDSATQLFRSYTTLEQVPALVRFLDQTADDLHEMVNEEK